ncbi:hypothetical protein [Salinibaculum rarum]|nr:hypothetical protein [Salinibaculum sp. KK48]
MSACFLTFVDPERIRHRQNPGADAARVPLATDVESAVPGQLQD